MANYRAETRRAAERYGLDPNIFTRQIRQESGFDPNARSRAGAIGIAQIMPDTARGWGVDPHDPLAALDAAAKHMAGYVKQFGSYRNALIAYNAGPGAVGGHLPSETQGYLQTILGNSNGGGGLLSPTGSSSSQSAQPSRNSTPQLLDAGQGSDFTSLLGSLLAKPQPAQPSTTPIQAPSFAAGPKLPQGAQLLQPTAAPAPQQQDRFSDALGLVGALGGSGPTLGPDQASGAPQTGPVQPTGDAPPGSSQGATVAALVGRADQIDAQRLPYRWGGGHGGKVNPAKAEPLDCSGAVSAVLGIDPRVSGQFTSWGKAGDGGDNGVTVYANGHHVLMKINGHFFGTSASNPGGGAGWIPRTAIGSGYLKNFTARHL